MADFGRCIVLATIRNVAYRSAGQLLGANATAAVLAAQNEALNNSISDKVTKWVKETYQDPLGDLARWGKQFLGMLPGQTPLAEAYPLVEATKGGNPPATGGAVVTPPTMSCSPNGQCVVAPPIASPGTPGNAILSSDNSNNESNSGSMGSSGDAGNKIGIDESRAQHIFRNSEGHIRDTPANRKILETVANDPSAILGTDEYGTTWAARLNPDGTQTWVAPRWQSELWGNQRDAKAFQSTNRVSFLQGQVNEMNETLTVNEAYRAMFIFLEQYYERDGGRSDDIAAMLSGMAPTIWADCSTNDPAQLGDWLKAVHAAKNEAST
ncbi:hypothetical protein [Cupriavidus respiraculi]|uniref:hypothetical protein n=1 Tax=Cupriavidus respiraculi TaxID=195930 RepID=UPI001CC3E03B|nr:hypothetical protein [Cupriavidus respiraculi]